MCKKQRGLKTKYSDIICVHQDTYDEEQTAREDFLVIYIVENVDDVAVVGFSTPLFLVAGNAAR